MAVNITIKGIPKEVYERLRIRAKAQRRSINAQILTILEDQLSAKPMDVEERIKRVREIKRNATGTLDMEEIIETIEQGRP
ncbi:MAG: Arc family DNA-binding protein [Bacteroidales bacterium]|nr:Arc family DNA-binding protein [Bacteroidales bacterium]